MDLKVVTYITARSADNGQVMFICAAELVTVTSPAFRGKAEAFQQLSLTHLSLPFLGSFGQGNTRKDCPGTAKHLGYTCQLNTSTVLQNGTGNIYSL